MKIEFNQVEKRFGKHVALDNVSCQIPPGTVGAVIGLNGAGKTTWMRCMAGVLMPNAGEVLFDGNPFDRRDMAFRRRLCFLPDALPVLPYFSALRHAAMVFELYGRDLDPHREELMELFAQFDLLPKLESPLGALSRGQLYKAILAPLCCIDPEVWLVDEPFAAGMDPEGMSLFKEKATERARRGGTVLFTTQILEVVEDFADVMYVLHQGKLVETLPVKEWRGSGGRVKDEVSQLLKRLRSGEVEV